jgi:MYXO-CTERM domain-containing protein
MNSKLRAISFAGLLFAAMSVVSPRAHACKCVMPTPQTAKDSAEAVFEGRVTSIEREPPPGPVGVGMNVVTFALVRVWKGLESEETVVVRTSEQSAACGIEFEKDKSYLVYAAKGDKGLQAGACGGTRPMSDASADLAVLGGGITPVKVEPAKKDDAKKPPAVKSAGCGWSAASSSKTSSLWLAAPALGMVLVRRKRR